MRSIDDSKMHAVAATETDRPYPGIAPAGFLCGDYIKKKGLGLLGERIND